MHWRGESICPRMRRSPRTSSEATVTPTSAVFDASAVVRAAVDRSPAARTALDRAGSRLAPDLVYAEVTSALLLYRRTGAMDARTAAEVLDEILRIPFDVRSSASLAGAAAAIAEERRLSAYDAMYVALAEAAKAPLVTADRRLAAAYERSELIS